MKRVIFVSFLMMGMWMFAQVSGNPLNVTINATVAERLTLVLETNSINFPDADPDTVASIPANENSVDVSVRIRGGGNTNYALTVAAGGNLISGTDNIAITNVTWTAAGAGYVNGTMNTVAQSVWSGQGSGRRDGTFNYFLANSWSYAVGNYTATVTYTLASI